MPISQVPFAGISNPVNFRNRIINGDMQIDQRNSGASVTPTDGVFITDRWKFGVSQASKFTAQRSSTAPSNFVNSLLITSSSAYSIVAGDFFNFQQRIEGYNISDLNWGTANAKSITISFWVRSSLTGTFGGAVSNSASNRSYPFTYSISSANTFEYKTITIAGDTSGTWLTTNGIGLLLSFGFGVGSTYSGTAGAWASAYYLSATGATSVVGTSGATLYITGVQLEAGEQASGFEFMPYDVNLQRCQRYCYRYYIANNAGNQPGPIGFADTTTVAVSTVLFPVEQRAIPTLVTTGTASDYAIRIAGVSTLTCNAVPTANNGTISAISTIFTVASGLTQGQGIFQRGNVNTAYLIFTSEL